MANNRTLTAANAVIMLGITGLYDVPRRLQGFSADDVADVEAVSTGETGAARLQARAFAGSLGLDGADERAMRRAQAEGLRQLLIDFLDRDVRPLL